MPSRRPHIRAGGGRLFAAMLAAALLLAGCGGEPDEPLAETLSYLGEDSGLVVVARTDFEEGELAELGEVGRSLPGWDLFLAEVREALAVTGERFEEDVEPQLGESAVFATGVAGSGSRLAMRLQDPAAQSEAVAAAIERGELRALPDYEGAEIWLRDGAEELPFGAVHEDTLVLAESEEQVRAAIDSSQAPENLSTNDALTARLDQLGEQAPLRVVADVQRALQAWGPTGSRAREVPWVRAIDIAGGSLRVRDGEVTVELVLDTDRRELEAGELPLALGPEAPRLLDTGAPFTVSLRDPERSARFAMDLLDALGLETGRRLQAAAERLRSQLDLDLIEDLAGRADEVSVAIGPDGLVQATAPLNDPEGLEADLRRAPLAVAAIAEELGLEGVEVDRDDDLLILLQDGDEVARVAVEDEALQVSVGVSGLPGADLEPLERLVGALGLRVDLGQLDPGSVDSLPAAAAALLATTGLLVSSVESDLEATRLIARLELPER